MRSIIWYVLLFTDPAISLRYFFIKPNVTNIILKQTYKIAVFEAYMLYKYAFKICFCEIVEALIFFILKQEAWSI